MAIDPFSDEAAEDFLTGNAIAAKWPKVGYVVEGTVTDWRMQQQIDYDSGESLYWEGNKRVEESEAVNKSRPVMQLLVDIQGEPTGETWEGLQNTPVELADDDGTRTLYVKGALQAAFKNALKKAEAKLEKGAYVRVERIKDGPKSNPKYQAPHRYAAQWMPASQNPKAAEALLSGEASTPFDD